MKIPDLPLQSGAHDSAWCLLFGTALVDQLRAKGLSVPNLGLVSGTWAKSAFERPDCLKNLSQGQDHSSVHKRLLQQLSSLAIKGVISSMGEITHKIGEHFKD